MSSLSMEGYKHRLAPMITKGLKFSNLHLSVLSTTLSNFSVPGTCGTRQKSFPVWGLRSGGSEF